MSASGSDRPNLLFIITDQQRADHAGFAGNPIVQTPNLDRLAARSTVFDQAYVANPICMPNRSTILTGRMPTSHGVIFNDRSLDWGANTFARSLRSAGYRTGLIGKSHLQIGLDKHLLPKSGRAPAIRDGFPDDVYTYEFIDRYLDDDFEDPEDFYGFDTVEFSIDHGARIAGHHLRWALERGVKLEDVHVAASPEAPARRRSDLWWQIYEPPYEPEVHSTTFVTERTVAFIEQAEAEQRPWMAWCSFPDPHHPMTPPGKWFDRYSPDDMPLPASFDDRIANAPEHIRRIRDRGPTPVWVLPFGTDEPRLVREALAATYGMIEFIDEGIGQVLDTVERLGATERTIVIFTTDHGDLMGDHGLLVKGNIHYEGVIRVPLLIARPDAAPARSDSLVCSLDLAPTVLDLFGLDHFGGMQGVSLAPVLENPTAEVRDALLIEDDMPSYIAPLLRVPEKIRSVVTKTARLTRDSDGGEQLFDRGEDPEEIRDLSSTDAALRGELMTRLADEMMRIDDQGRGVLGDRSG